MRSIKFGKTGRDVPVIALGLMRLNGLDDAAAGKYIRKAMELGVTFFDHADIYGGGSCEEIFGRTANFTAEEREQVFIQSKCAIVPGKMFDFSKKHIIESVDGSLKRLQTEYLDALLLHRPDALAEPEEVAEAFDELESADKVRYFGVSNERPYQIELLKTCVKQDIQANQLQFSIPAANMVASGIEANMDTPGSFDHDGDVLNYSRINHITIQAWSPFQRPNWAGPFIGSDACPELNAALSEIAGNYGVSETTIAAAWILRHPAKMQLIAGTMNEKHLAEICQAADITLTREEWYKLYLAAGYILP